MSDVSATATARQWAEEWARAHGGKPLSSRAAIGEAAGIFFGHVATAHVGDYLSVVDHPTERYPLPPLPDGANLILIRGAVRWGFALKHGDAIWMGYSVAGNGTPTHVWPATPELYAAFAALTR